MNNETQADILAEMRRGDTHGINRIYTIPRRNPHTGYYDIEGVTLDELADRLEAAAERDKQDAMKTTLMAKCEICARLAPQGNAAVMRAALLRVKEARGRDLEYVTLADIDADVDAAISAPPRNCDVGKPEEQEARYKAFCSRYYGTNDMSGDNCRVCPLSPFGCQFAWMQMPYEAGGAE